MGKRDRWASSSDEDDNLPKQKGSRQTNENESEKGGHDGDSSVSHHESNVTYSIAPNTPFELSHSRYLHNPLVHGCRSVYDTYERISRVSEGTYGVVWKARYVGTDEIVALKQIKFDVFDEQSATVAAIKGGTKSSFASEGFPVTALREISVLLELSHESIVSVKEMVVGDGIEKVFMVMEFFEFDLKEGLSRFDGALAQSELKGILRQVLQGVEHVHSKWFLHRDLKPSNILVHRSGRVALADFGLARRYQDPPCCMTQLVVTLWYRSPELLFGEDKYGPAVDMWSVGCIFGELIRKESLFRGQGELDQIDQVFAMLGVPNETTWPTFESLPNAGLFRWKPRKPSELLLPKLFPVASTMSANQAFLDMNGYNLLTKLLLYDPSKRISSKDALNHAYFKEGVEPKVPRFFSSA